MLLPELQYIRPASKSLDSCFLKIYILELNSHDPKSKYISVQSCLSGLNYLEPLNMHFIVYFLFDTFQYFCISCTNVVVFSIVFCKVR